MDKTMKGFVLAGILISLALAFFLSPWASPFPDGLERVAEDKGFLARAEGEPLFKAPIPDYAWPGVNSETLATSLAGLFGTLLTFAVGYFLALALTRRGAKSRQLPDGPNLPERRI